MDVNNIDAFLKEVKPSLEELARRRDTDIGFNAFALISDIYYRENFHSDILAAILDPKGKHGEGVLFLDLFRKFLVGVAQRHGQSDLAAELEKLKIDGSIEVARESDGRIDVEIKGPDWVIIVENKINGACDQERQLPRYVEGVEKNGYTVKAIVYLTAAHESEPAQVEWKDGDAEMVNKLLLPVVGYTEDSRIVDLVTGWLEPCELRSKAFSTRAVLSQYGELVRNQAGETMDEFEARKMFFSIKKYGIDYTELKNTIDRLPEVLAGMIVEHMRGKPGVASVDNSWNASCAVLHLPAVTIPRRKSLDLKVDVVCHPDWHPHGISFQVGSDDNRCLNAFVELLKSFNQSFKSEQEGARIILEFDANTVYGNVETFISRIGELVDFLHEHRKDVESLAHEKC